MKKLILTLLTLIMALSLVACGGATDTTEAGTPAEPTEITEPVE